MENAKPKPAQGTVAFILITAFINLAGIGILSPVLPAITAQYVRPENVDSMVGLLFLSYSLCQFIAVPTLGALSDRFGRRPVLLISLLGSAAGYLIFGVGGALWVLFLGRIVDGLTGGNIAAIYAYAADITEPKERTKFFGLVGAFAGMGFIVGPAVGGLLSLISNPAPLYFGALVTLLNTVWGYFAMPESLSADKRAVEIPLARLNPFSQLVDVFRLLQIRYLLAGIFLWTFAFAILQSNLSALTETHLGWTPAGTSTIFFLIGSIGILVQGFLIPRWLPRFGEGKLAMGGLMLLTIGFLLLSTVAVSRISALVYVSILFTALGNGLVTPSITGLLSQSVGAREQGRVQGGNQSVQALARVIGPLVVAALTINPANLPIPYLIGACGFVVGIVMINRAIPILQAHQDKITASQVIDPATFKPDIIG